MSTGKTILIATVIALFLWTGNSLHAEDFAPPHTFKDGEVISSDLLNESLDKIKNRLKKATSADLVGTWSCSIYTTTSLPSPTYSNFTLLTDELLYVGSNYQVTFTDDGDGTYSFSSNDIHWLSLDFTTVDDPLTGDYTLLGLRIFYRMTSTTSVQMRVLDMLSDTQFQVRDYNPSSHQLHSSFCDKQNLPPVNPTLLTASVSGSEVTLLWTDNSSDETGFKVTRKDTITGAWADLSTEAANTASYIDTVTTAGTYWYRVKSTSANGDSLGSNVVTVTVN